MDSTRFSLTHLADSALEDALRHIVAENNGTLADLICHLAEVEERKLYLAHACSSLFTFCTTRLGFSEDEACKRIQAARIARTYPVIFAMVAEGRLHLSAVSLLAPHLTSDNYRELLAAACGKSKRAVEEMIAARFPRPDAPTYLRKEPAPRLAPQLPMAPAPAPIPAPAPATAAASAPALPLSASMPATTSGSASSCSPSPSASSSSSSCAADAPSAAAPAALPSAAVQGGPFALAVEQAPCGRPAAKAKAEVEPLSATRFRLQVTLSREGRDTLLRLQALMRHSVPNGDLGVIVERALASLCAQVEARVLGKRRGGRQEDAQNQAAAPVRAAARAVAPASGPAPASAPGRIEAADEASSSASVSHPASGSAAAEGPAESVLSAPGRIEAADQVSSPASALADQSRSRRISNAVRRAVIAREGWQCSFVDAAGQRCAERAFLQFHHITPVARGGASSAANVTIRCVAHHAAQTDLDFGGAHVRARVAAARRRWGSVARAP